MQRYWQNGCAITLEKEGADRYAKISYPQRYGRYSEVETADAIYQFNPGGEIIFAKGKGPAWPDPQEWLKRTIGNDWIYYSTGGYTGVYEAIGEFYLPNLQYPTNALIGGKPFANEAVRRIINGWHDTMLRIREASGAAPPPVRELLDEIASNDPVHLAEKARRLFHINGGRVTVLPPDARHVDYNVIPLTVSRGCLYKCRFCKVKTPKPFAQMEREEIDRQLKELVQLYGRSLVNYNAIFLGEHDALSCSANLLLYAIGRAYGELQLASSCVRGAAVFLFGSVDSFLNAHQELFDELAGLPCLFYINIGLESADQETLDRIGKPISSRTVEDAFRRMQHINERYGNIEITANFLMDAELPPNHYASFLRLVRDGVPRRRDKGTVYLSPLKFDAPSRALMFEFHRLKLHSRLPTFLYIIQRL